MRQSRNTINAGAFKTLFRLLDKFEDVNARIRKNLSVISKEYGRSDTGVTRRAVGTKRIRSGKSRKRANPIVGTKGLFNVS